MTNKQKIQSASDEELANLLLNIIDRGIQVGFCETENCPHYYNGCCNLDIECCPVSDADIFKWWLTQEAKEEDYNA